VTGQRELLFSFPGGGWCCTRQWQTEPCGDCDGCRYVASVNLTHVPSPAPTPPWIEGDDDVDDDE